MLNHVTILLLGVQKFAEVAICAICQSSSLYIGIIYWKEDRLEHWLGFLKTLHTQTSKILYVIIVF